MPEMTYKQWMIIVNHLLARQFGGLDSRDLPDYCWRDLWEENVTPREAVEDFKLEGYF